MSLSKQLIHLPWISENTLIDLEANRSYLLYLRQNIKYKLKRVFSSHFSISFLYCVSNKHNNLFGGSLPPKENVKQRVEFFPETKLWFARKQPTVWQKNQNLFGLVCHYFVCSNFKKSDILISSYIPEKIIANIIPKVQVPSQKRIQEFWNQSTANLNIFQCVARFRLGQNARKYWMCP